LPTNLGERLAEKELVALLNKVSDGKRVLEDITRREALVSLNAASVKFSCPEQAQSAQLAHELTELDNHGEVERTMSKNGKCFFSLTISESSFHCASVGSIPVGFCICQRGDLTT
jgi:hypothetical protein